MWLSWRRSRIMVSRARMIYNVGPIPAARLQSTLRAGHRRCTSSCTSPEITKLPLRSATRLPVQCIEQVTLVPCQFDIETRECTMNFSMTISPDTDCNILMHFSEVELLFIIARISLLASSATVRPAMDRVATSGPSC